MAKPREGDADPTRPSDSATDDLSLRLQREAAAHIRAATSDLNFQKPPVQYGYKGKRIYESAPTPLKRLFGSPLVPSGKYATGRNRERRVNAGWGAPRNFSYEKGVNTRSRHQGLDFAASFNEALFACADGKVVFTGIQTKLSRQSVRFAEADIRGNVLDDKGAIVATPNLLGFGGIAVHVRHDGDFQGYQTEYYHMQKIVVAEGARVTEGQLIGYVGKTGVPGIGPHLHFQISFLQGKTSAFVNPTGLVPNSRPGKADSTNTENGQGIILPPYTSLALQTAASQAANTLNALSRGVASDNRTHQDMHRTMASYMQGNAQKLGVGVTTLNSAEAAATAVAPRIIGGMQFDFTAGVWRVDGNERGPV